MNNDIKKDIYIKEKEDYINKEIEELLLKNPRIIEENPILEIEFNPDGTKKDIYMLSSERDIKETQIKSDLNEIEYKFNQKIIKEDEYNKLKSEIENKIKEQNLLYNDLIFNIINSADLESIKNSIIKYNLNEIDLKRLLDAIKAVSEYKIEEFTNNNKKFMLDKLSYWNYKYDELSKAISKSREVESFILSLIE